MLWTSGAENNFKVGAHGRRETSEIFCRAPPLFWLSIQVQVVVLVSAFVMVSSLYSLVSFLFAVFILTLLTPALWPWPALWSRRHCL